MHVVHNTSYKPVVSRGGFSLDQFWSTPIGSLPLRMDLLYRAYVKYKIGGTMLKVTYLASPYTISIKGCMIAQQKVASCSQQKGKGKLSHAQEPSSSSAPSASSSHLVVAPLAPNPMPHMGISMVPTLQKSKHQMFELPFPIRKPH